jgi:hypothetical protein
MADIRNACKILVRKIEVVVPFDKLKRRWKIILRCVLEKEDINMGTGFNWLMLKTGGGLLRTE